MPPSLREWLPENHLAWCVIDAVGEFDLAAFYGAYRADGWGRAAHDPAMMVALLLYAYAIGERSSRRIERHCEQDVAFRVIAANQVPDHATIARFRVRHERALGGAVRRGAGAVRGGRAGRGRGDRGRRHEGARQRVPARDARLRADRGARSWPRPTPSIAPRTSATASGAAMSCRRSSRPPRAGAGGCARPSAGSKSGAPRRRARSPARVRERLQEAKRRLEEEHRVECQANADYEAYRARGRMKDGRRFGRPPDPHEPPATPAGKVNLTDPDSRNVKTPRGWVQGYNAQAVCTENQIVIAAEVTIDSPDFGHLGADDRGRRDRARGGRDHRHTRDRARRRRLLAPGADGAAHRPRNGGLDPARRRQTQGRPARAGTAASTRSCAACSRPTAAASSTPNAKA